MKIKPKFFSENHIGSRVEWINNPSINKTMFFDLPATIEKTKKWYINIVNNDNRVDFTFVDDSENVLAMGGITNIDSNNNNGEFYVMVNPKLHGKGIGKSVSFWMYNYAFSVLNLHRLYLYTDDKNLSAYKIYENAGFILEGTLREHKFKNKKHTNRRVYGMLKSEWETMSWKKIIDKLI